MWKGNIEIFIIAKSFQPRHVINFAPLKDESLGSNIVTIRQFKIIFVLRIRASRSLRKQQKRIVGSSSLGMV